MFVIEVTAAEAGERRRGQKERTLSASLKTEDGHIMVSSNDSDQVYVLEGP